MKSYAPAARAAIEDGTAIVEGAVEILTTPPVRVWSGLAQLPIAGHTYEPLGNNTLAIASGASLGGVARNLSLTVSGLEPKTLALLDAPDLARAPVAIWTVILDGSGTQVLDAQVHRRGRVDRVPVRETSGGTASVTIEVEMPGRGLGRKTGRMRSDADQRLITPTDGGMRLVSYAGEKMLYWGGRRPARAGSVANGGALRERGGRSFEK